MLHRSVSFWSGLFVLLFLAWAWRDSGRNYSFLEYSRPKWTLGFYTGDGMLRATLNTEPDAFGTPGLTYGRRDFGFMGKSKEFDMAPGGLIIDLRAPFREIRMAAWFLLIPYFNAWIFLILWRYIRRKKADDLTAILQAASKEAEEKKAKRARYTEQPPEEG